MGTSGNNRINSENSQKLYNLIASKANRSPVRIQGARSNRFANNSGIVRDSLNESDFDLKPNPIETSVHEAISHYEGKLQDYSKDYTLTDVRKRAIP